MASTLRAGAAPGETRAKLIEIPGMVPQLAEMPNGCAFAPRCAHVSEVCRRSDPDLTDTPHRVACHNPLNGGP